MYAFLILLLRSNELFHSQELKAMFVLETVQSLCEEISTIFCAGDMRSADSLCHESCRARAGTWDSGTDLASAVHAALAQLLCPGFVGVHCHKDSRQQGG